MQQTEQINDGAALLVLFAFFCIFITCILMFVRLMQIHFRNRSRGDRQIRIPRPAVKECECEIIEGD